jgi:single-strand DNA-binding protein
MAEGLNRVMLLGNLGADPELRYTQGGQAVLNLRLATTESYLDREKVRRERTDWHNVVIWGKRAEALGKFLGKGERIFVEGSLRTSSYDDREGNKRYKTEIVAQNVILAGRAGRGAGAEEGGYEGRGGGRGGPAPGGPRQPQGADDAPPDDFGGGYGGDDDIPF